jgi:hypothetical protein
MLSILITTAALATAQPAPGGTPPAPEIPAWLEKLAGSCFHGHDHHRNEVRRCFARREGKFAISSSFRSASEQHRSECVVEPIAWRPEYFNLKCLQDGVHIRNLEGQFEGQQMHLQVYWRRRDAPPPVRPGESWELLDAIRLSITSDYAADLLRTVPIRSSAVRRLILTRVPAR